MTKAHSVPPQKPWEPLGYQVVVTSEEPGRVPPPERPPTPRFGGEWKLPTRDWLNSPGEDRAPDVGFPDLSRRFREPADRGKRTPQVLFMAGVFGLFTIVALGVVAACSFSSAPDRYVYSESRRHEPVIAEPARDLPQRWEPPPIPEIVIPEDLVGDAPVEPVANPAVAKALPEDGICPETEVCEAPADRQTFGTAIRFVRNPQEALRLAAGERKLSFILHVSGNFEEARFT